jgi:hypothetical protein
MIADSSSGVAAVKEAFLCPRRAPLASHSRLGAYGGGWVAAEPPQPLSSDPPGTLGASYRPYCTWTVSSGFPFMMSHPSHHLPARLNRHRQHLEERAVSPHAHGNEYESISSSRRYDLGGAGSSGPLYRTSINCHIAYIYTHTIYRCIREHVHRRRLSRA